MSQADYARHRGVSRQAVGKLLSSGKIPASALSIGAGGARLINPAAADFALGQNRERIASSEADASADANFFGGLAASSPPAAAGAADAPAPGDGAGTLTAHRTTSEFYNSEIKRLEYEQRLGQLLTTADVTRSMEKCASVIVRELEQLPNLADDVAAALSRDGVPAVRQLLKNFAREIRGRLEQNMRVAAAEDGAGEIEAVAS